MFLRSKTRKKDGKEHRYWSVVENKRVSGDRVVQKHVLYFGEINSSQELAWRKSIDVLEEGSDQPKTLALFPEDRCEGVLPDASIVRLKLSDPPAPSAALRANGAPLRGQGPPMDYLDIRKFRKMIDRNRNAVKKVRISTGVHS